MVTEKACLNCRHIISQGDVCPICGGTKFTTKWSGYVVILNVEKSELAKKLGINVNGVYALHIQED
ncbi:MAG: transcription elongation factor subunit Spt4 [Candidatus Micrarchaeia archaeon]